MTPETNDYGSTQKEVENNNYGLTQKELKNNNFNPELEAFLSDNLLAKEEADILNDMFEENKRGIILISKQNLDNLRKIIGSNSKVNYISSNDKKIIKNLYNLEHTGNDNIQNNNNVEIKNNHIDKNGYLSNVTKVRLDEIVGPSEMINFSIKLSENSLYDKNMDGKTYNVIWGNDITTGKQTYIFENGPKKGRRAMISNGDKLGEYLTDSNKTDNIINKNEKLVLNNKNFIEKLDLPDNYKKIAEEFIGKLKSNEILTEKTPIALVDYKSKEMAYIINGKTILVPILLGKNGVTTGSYVPNDRKTPIGKIHRFNPNISKIAENTTGDASNSQKSKTVLSASLQSDLSNSYGGRYFHGVADYRIEGRNKGMGTWGCVGVDVNTIRRMYNDVKNNKKGYGYVA